MDELRKPLLIVAIALIVVAFLIEVGSTALLGGVEVNKQQLRKMADAELRKDEDYKDEDDRNDVLDEMEEKLEESREDNEPPGYGIPATGLLDLLLINSVVWMGLALVVPERIQGRIQGVVNLIFSIILLIVSVIGIIVSVVILMIMVGLLFSPPFGTIIYLAVYGFFNRATAGVLLGWAMFFKLCFAGCLVFAHQGFLKNKGLIFTILLSLLATFLVSFLHNFVPIFLVSITDVIGAIIVLVITAVWSIVLLVFSIIAVVKAIT